MINYKYVKAANSSLLTERGISKISGVFKNGGIKRNIHIKNIELLFAKSIIAPGINRV